MMFFHREMLGLKERKKEAKKERKRINNNSNIITKNYTLTVLNIGV